MPTHIQEDTTISKDSKNSPSVPNKELKTKKITKEIQSTKDQHESKIDIWFPHTRHHTVT